jgi:hypothetical protein
VSSNKKKRTKPVYYQKKIKQNALSFYFFLLFSFSSSFIFSLNFDLPQTKKKTLPQLAIKKTNIVVFFCCIFKSSGDKGEPVVAWPHQHNRFASDRAFDE